VVAGLSAGDQGALILGPALGGALYQAARALPFLADAVSYAVAAGCVRVLSSDLRPDRCADAGPGTASVSEVEAAARIDGGATAPAPQPHPARRICDELGAGLALVRSSPLLHLVLIWTATVNGVIVALYYGAVFTLWKGGHGGAPIGLVLALSGAAGLAGSLAAPRRASRAGSGPRDSL
jgi:hypothetical protein